MDARNPSRLGRVVPPLVAGAIAGGLVVGVVQGAVLVGAVGGLLTAAALGVPALLWARHRERTGRHGRPPESSGS